MPKKPDGPAGNRSNGSFRLLGALVLAAILFGTSTIEADPLPPLGDTLEKTTDTVGKTVSGVGKTVGKTVSGTTEAVTGNTATSAPTVLGRDITQPVGILTPALQATPPQQTTTRSSTAEPSTRNEYRPYDVYRSDLPDTLGRGTLARIYFDPGVATLDGTAENRIAGFAQTFAQRVGNVEVRGFADRSSGDDARANDLALRRAQAVHQALLEHGIASGRLRASGMGNTGSDDAAEDRVDILFDGY